MSIEILSLLFVAVFIAILLAGVPLAFATGAVAVVFAYALFGLPGLTLVISRVFTLMGNYVLVSVPLFIFMACILERAGRSSDSAWTSMRSTCFRRAGISSFSN